MTVGLRTVLTHPLSSYCPRDLDHLDIRNTRQIHYNDDIMLTEQDK